MVQFERKKPLGLLVAMVALGFIGIVGSLASVGILASLLGDGPFLMNGQAVSKAEFARFLIPFMSFYLPVCLLAAAIAFSIRNEHPRSRPLLLLYSCVLLPLPLVFLALGVPAADAFTPLAPGLVVPVLAWFYLYRKDAVVQYYTAIEMDREPFPESDFP